jgi:HD superfamily phosphohydrolase YqeK
MGNKERFISILRTMVQRTGIEKLISKLEQSDFFTAPASTKYHESYQGGLVEHSLNVYDFLMSEYQYNERFAKITNPESIAVVALLHDICKMHYYKEEMRNTKDENGKWIQVPFYTVEDQLPLGHGEKSVFLIKEFIDLSLEEVMAIRWHMGLSEPKENYNYISKAFSEFPLALYLHIADMKAIYIKK